MTVIGCYVLQPRWECCLLGGACRMQWRPSDFIINSTIILFMLRVSPIYSTHTHTHTHTCRRAYLIAGNFRMVKIFLHILNTVQSVRKLEPTKIFASRTCIRSPMAFYRYLKPLRCSRCPCKYGSLVSWTPWWKKHTPWINKFVLA